MASLFRLADGRKRIQFYDGNGNRRSIGLGSISNRNAERIRDKVEQLVEHRITQTPLDQSVSRWLADLDDKLHAKLVKAELAKRQESNPESPSSSNDPEGMALITFYDRYMSECGDLKKSSQSVYASVRRNLVEFFGIRKKLTEITEFDADNFRRFLKSKRYAEATMRSCKDRRSGGSPAPTSSEQSVRPSSDHGQRQRPEATHGDAGRDRSTSRRLSHSRVAAAYRPWSLWRDAGPLRTAVSSMERHRLEEPADPFPPAQERTS